MKRFVCYLLLVVFIISTCSCGSASNEEFLLDLNGINSDPSKIDFDGYECTILQEYDLERPFQYPVGTLMADLYLQRLNDISEEFNCNVTLQKTNGSEAARIIANLYVGEIACTHDPSGPARSGFYYPLDSLNDYLDLTDFDKFGSPGLLEQGMYNGVPYSISPVSWPGKQMAYTYNTIAVNEGTIARYAKTDPREYVENGEWTWDTFMNVLPDYQIYDGEYSSTAFNLTWTILDFAMMNGADYVSVKDDGEVVPALNSPAIIEAFDWCAKLLTTHKDIISYLGHYEMVDGFIAGEITLAQTSFSHLINEIIYDVDNYGVVPFPCGPHGTYGRWANAYSGFDSMAIWVNANEPEAAAIVLDRLFEPFEGYENISDIREYASGIFYDDRDIDFFTSYLNYSRWNYYTCGIWDYFSSATTFAKTGKSGTEYVESYAEAANLNVEKYVIPNYGLINQLEQLGQIN